MRCSQVHDKIPFNRICEYRVDRHTNVPWVILSCLCHTLCPGHRMYRIADRIPLGQPISAIKKVRKVRTVLFLPRAVSMTVLVSDRRHFPDYFSNPC